MKIKTKEMEYEKVLQLPKEKKFKPVKPNFLFRTLRKIAGNSDLKDTNFTYTFIDHEKWDKGPYLMLMNHSSFIDLEMVSTMFYKMPHTIVTTSDGFVGKKFLMKNLGCIPTNKFTTDMNLISLMQMSIKKNLNVLMYPEASYTFDGCATPLQRGLGILLKKLNVPVLMIKTEGAFLRDPLYNCLQKRKVNVSAKVYQLLSQSEIKSLSLAEITKRLDDAFTFDEFKYQLDNKIEITEPFRADGLDRVLYKCPDCLCENKMEGKGEHLVCHNCNKTYFLNKYGQLESEGEVKFSHIPDWYRWEREEVKKELEENKYLLDTEVKIGVLVDTKALYMVGEGRLVHNKEGFVLYNDKGEVMYSQKPLSSYGLYADYFWYEIDDMICIGNKDILYYCFPKTKISVAKARLATEELYKIVKNRG